MSGKNTYTQHSAELKKQRIVAMLKGAALTWTEVADLLHCHKQTASRYLWHMARQPQPRLIHVARWVEDEASGRKIPAFIAGNGSNKKKPPPLTSAEVFSRIQADTARYSKRKAKYRADWHRKKGQPIPVKPATSPFAALGV